MKHNYCIKIKLFFKRKNSSEPHSGRPREYPLLIKRINPFNMLDSTFSVLDHACSKCLPAISKNVSPPRSICKWYNPTLSFISYRDPPMYPLISSLFIIPFLVCLLSSSHSIITAPPPPALSTHSYQVHISYISLGRICSALAVG